LNLAERVPIGVANTGLILQKIAAFRRLYGAISGAWGKVRRIEDGNLRNSEKAARAAPPKRLFWKNMDLLSKAWHTKFKHTRNIWGHTDSLLISIGAEERSW
jgi:hypothetical protein